MPRPFQKHLKSSDDLCTPHEATRAGFIALALEKNRRATPFVAEARLLRAAASTVATPQDLMDIADIRSGLLTASGVSDKAAGHLNEADKQEAISGLIRNYLEPAGSQFVEELVFRFLLTRGDTLGGSMRNAGGFMAKCKLTRCLIAHLNLAGIDYRWRADHSKVWSKRPESDADIEMTLRGLAWNHAGKKRTLIYNLTVPLIKKNVDMCLFNCEAHALSKQVYAHLPSYVAMGELKGGIDPAGADEHWKTAQSALKRITVAFSKKNLVPHTFFVGAAIEKSMAEEIWQMLASATLENAANLNDQTQMSSLARWLCSL